MTLRQWRWLGLLPVRVPLQRPVRLLDQQRAQ